MVRERLVPEAKMEKRKVRERVKHLCRVYFQTSNMASTSLDQLLMCYWLVLKDCQALNKNGAPLGSILGPTLFLFYRWPSELGIYSEDKSIYLCFNTKSDRLDKLKLAVDLKSYLKSAVNWHKKWLFNFNTSKSNLLSVNHLI